ncbi:MAG: YeeE/YedE thiosulfate transporter family protein [Bacteroidota bacterium]
MKNNIMNPYAAGLLLGLLLLAVIFITGRGLGASGAFRSAAAAAVTAAAPGYAASREFYGHAAGSDASPLKNWLVFEVAGMILGAFLSGVVSGRLTLETERPPHVSSNRRLAAALAGGALFGMGSQLARGCTSGAALSGMAVFSLGGILTMLAIFGSAYGVAWFFRRLWI